MEKAKLVAEKLKKVPRILSGLLRVQSVLDDPKSYFGKTDSVGGWIKSVRRLEKDTLLFINVSDGSCNRSL